MSIPHDDVIKNELLNLLYKAPKGTMHCNDVYDQLAELFPQLTDDELTLRYRESKSKWANLVQFARQHCVEDGHIFDFPSGKGRGYWTITDEGRRYVENHRSKEQNQKGEQRAKEIIDELLKKNGVKKEIERLVTIKEQELTDSGAFNPNSIQDSRERSIALIVRRRGQPEFRRRLLEIYGKRCAITGESAEQVLEAAHIIPYKGQETNHPSNGLLLRADLHTLFDLRSLTVDTVTMTVVVSPILIGTGYNQYAGKRLNLPLAPAYRPNVDALNTHRSESGI